MKKIALGLFLSAIAIQAHAETSVFAEALLGNAKQTAKIEDYGSVSAKDVAYGVRGGFNFNTNFALEAAYQIYGDAEDSYVDEYGDSISDEFSASALNAGVKGSIPLGEVFSISARIGIALWDLEYDGTDSSLPGESFSDDDDGNDIYYGLGAQLAFGDSIYVGAEYTITEMDVSLFGISVDHEIENLAVFVGFKF
jgi:OOP family OmpA-OmpF porin